MEFELWSFQPSPSGQNIVFSFTPKNPKSFLELSEATWVFSYEDLDWCHLDPTFARWIICQHRATKGRRNIAGSEELNLLFGVTQEWIREARGQIKDMCDVKLMCQQRSTSVCIHVLGKECLRKYRHQWLGKEAKYKQNNIQTMQRELWPLCFYFMSHVSQKKWEPHWYKVKCPLSHCTISFTGNVYRAFIVLKLLKPYSSEGKPWPSWLGT